MDLNLLAQTEILSSKKEYNHGAGLPVVIYFLIKENEIVYIGKTTRLFNRMKEHTKTKDFDSYSFIELETTDVDLVNKIEKNYIIKYSPLYNNRIGDFNCTTVEELAAKYQLDEQIISRVISGAYYEGKYRTDISHQCISAYLREKRLNEIDWAAEIDKYL